MFCKYCGKEIADTAVFCTNCGKQVKETNAPVNNTPVNNTPNNNIYVPRDENTIAIVGFVFSFLIALVGLICSIIGYRKAVNEGADHKGLALAGIIISAISMALGFIFTIVYGVALAALFAAV